MSFEYLIVGIAKGEQDDFREFYDKTKVQAYMFALSIVKDRVLARDIAVEAYKRVLGLAYKFDTELNAEYWLLDIVKNLSVNALRHDELKLAADSKRVDTLTGLLAELILDAQEDRAQIVVLRTVTGLKKSEISRLLWYKSGSASAEYDRAIKSLVSTAPDYRTKKSVKQDLFDDMTTCTPDMWGLVEKEDATRVSFVSHDEIDIDDSEVGFSEDTEEVKRIKRAADKKNRKIKIITAVIAIVVLCTLIAGAVVAVVAYNKAQAKKREEEKNETNVIDVTLPQSGTSLAMAELDGVLYYANRYDEGKLYKADFSSGSIVSTKISEDKPRDIVVCQGEEKYVVYRNQADGHAYRYSPADGKTVLLYKNVGAMCVSGDVLYFNVSSVGICSVKISEGESSFEEVLPKDNDFPAVIDIEVDKDGTVYFSGGASSGIYYIKTVSDEETGSTATYNEGIYAGSVYDMHLCEDEIFFDISENYSSFFCKIDKGDNNRVSQVEGVYLSSAAIFIDDGYVYYAGYDSDPEKNENAQSGLYRESVSGGTPELLIKQTDKTLYISDLYVTDSKIYCYSCSADGKSQQKLVAYTKDNLNKDNFVEKSIVIFG